MPILRLPIPIADPNSETGETFSRFLALLSSVNGERSLNTAGSVRSSRGHAAATGRLLGSTK
jgi:hypothetical protein